MIDNNNNLSNEFEMKLCTDKDKVLAFMKKVEHYFFIPLTERMDLEEYTEKILKYGKVLVITVDDEIVSFLTFYCNDTVGKKAFGTLAATLPEYRGKGLVTRLFAESERISYENGMRYWCGNTNINNHALGLYLKLGYKVISKNGDWVYFGKELKG